jgi:hypothetical protein
MPAVHDVLSAEPTEPEQAAMHAAIKRARSASLRGKANVPFQPMDYHAAWT